MKLYSVPGSPPSLIVRLTLAALKVPFELKNVDFVAAEHLTEEYAKMNPQKEIPVLDDDGFFLSESIAIVQYLCDKYKTNSSSSSLYPSEDVKKRAIINHRMCFNASFFYKHITAYATDPVFYGAEKTDEKLRKMHNALAVFERYLCDAGTKYAISNEITLADFALISATICLEATDFNFAVDYPLTSKWYDTFKAEHPELWKIASVDMVAISEYYKNAMERK